MRTTAATAKRFILGKVWISLSACVSRSVTRSSTADIPPSLQRRVSAASIGGRAGFRATSSAKCRESVLEELEDRHLELTYGPQNGTATKPTRTLDTSRQLFRMTAKAGSVDRPKYRTHAGRARQRGFETGRVDRRIQPSIVQAKGSDGRSGPGDRRWQRPRYH